MTDHAQRSVKGCRVLIIEDEYFLAYDLVTAFRLLGYEVIGPVPELDDAMSIEPNAFDVAVVDINLRGCLAYPIADELRNHLFLQQATVLMPFPTVSGMCGHLRNPVTLRRSRVRSACCVSVSLARCDGAADVSSGSKCEEVNLSKS